MNSVAKMSMGTMNRRLYAWVDEYQSGFRKHYSAAANIYNLTSIVHIKLAEILKPLLVRSLGTYSFLNSSTSEFRLNVQNVG